MSKLSPLYREDNNVKLDRELVAYLDKHYLKHLKNLDLINPKLLVVFSGGNAMGKTTISRKIEARFHGLVLENDEVKRHVLKFIPNIERDELNQFTWQYTIELYSRLNKVTSNGLVVRDGIIDWYYDRILPLFEKAGYQLFIIAFDTTREKAIELIKQRGDTPTVREERLYIQLEDHAIHIKRFRSVYTPDLVLSDDNLFDHERVLASLGHRLHELKSTNNIAE
jgi:predicted kinase